VAEEGSPAELFAKENFCFSLTECSSISETLVKRTKALRWEQQSNDCFEYQCNNESGYLSWSMCNTSSELHQTCVGGTECYANSTWKEDWTVNVYLEGSVNATDFDAKELIQIIVDITQIPKANVSIGVDVNTNGVIESVSVVVATESEAKKVESAINAFVKSGDCQESMCLIKSAKIDKVPVSAASHVSASFVALILLACSVIISIIH